MIKTRVFIACADERLRLAMLLLMDSEPGLVVVGITDRLPGLTTQLLATEPHVLLLEWDLPFQTMADLINEIHSLAHPPKVILLSIRPEEEEKIMAAGIDYFILQNAPPDKLLQILNDFCYQ